MNRNTGAFFENSPNSKKIENIDKDKLLQLLCCLASIESYKFENTEENPNRDDLEVILEEAAQTNSPYVDISPSKWNFNPSLYQSIIDLREKIKEKFENHKNTLSVEDIRGLKEFKMLREHFKNVVQRDIESDYKTHILTFRFIREIFYGVPSVPTESSFIKMSSTLNNPDSLARYLTNEIAKNHILPDSPPTSRY